MTARLVEAALADLEGLTRRGVPPDLHVARHVLLALGRALREQEPGNTAGWVQRVTIAGRAAGEAWSRAVRDELALACGEFVQCLDPRYIRLPDYDIEYTRAARARLEDRLRSARTLGFELPTREAELLVLADRVLATLEIDRAAAGRGLGSPERCAGEGRGTSDRSDLN